MDNIKNIIFDLGGVLLNINYNKTANAFKKLGFTNFEEMFNQYTSNSFFENFEQGQIDEDTFCKTFIADALQPITKEQIIHAWNEMLLNYRENSLAYLKHLSSKYNLFLLSNTNIIHYQKFQQKLQKQLGISSLNNLFTKAWYSHEINLRKPNADIYAFVLQDGNLKANETFFIDDTLPNVEVARMLGIKSHLLLPNELIENIGL